MISAKKADNRKIGKIFLIVHEKPFFIFFLHVIDYTTFNTISIAYSLFYARRCPGTEK